MDPATAAVMLLLSCTPDTLLCRKLPEQAGRFESVTICEAMLPAQIERLSNGNNRIIGRCEVPNASSQWAKLPDSTVATTLEREERVARHISPPRQADEVTTGSVGERTGDKNETVPKPSPVTEELDEVGLTVVRVTRMVSGMPVTTAYVVGKN